MKKEKDAKKENGGKRMQVQPSESTDQPAAIQTDQTGRPNQPIDRLTGRRPKKPTHAHKRKEKKKDEKFYGA